MGMQHYGQLQWLQSAGPVKSDTVMRHDVARLLMIIIIIMIIIIMIIIILVLLLL